MPDITTKIGPDAPKAAISYDFRHSTLLGLDYAFENIFEVRLIPDSSNSPDLSDFPIQNIKGISIPSLGINLKRSTLTRRAHVDEDSIVYHDAVNITFQEDINYSVTSFFEKWFTKYYNVKNNTWVTGKKDKYISLQIVLTPFSDSPLGSQSLTSRKGKQLSIRITGLTIPKSLPKYSLEYGKADDIKHELSFMAEKIESIVKDSVSPQEDPSRSGDAR